MMGAISYFNPRSPCGERPVPPALNGMIDKLFQSTLPVWGATQPVRTPIQALAISIHAPRVGSDEWVKRAHNYAVISIHAPRVGSDHTMVPRLHTKSISIHAPRVGSDFGTEEHHPSQDISIHAPRVGATWKGGKEK